MNQPKNPPDNIFNRPAEEPAAGAYVYDEETGGVQTAVTAEGHLSASVPLDGVDPYDHTTEQDAIHQQKLKDGVAPPPLPEAEATPLRNPVMSADSTDALKEEMERRFQAEMGDLKVTVTPAERDAFVRAALLDREMVFDIWIDGLNVNIKVAIPPDEFTNSASAAVNHWANSGWIEKGSDLQWMLAFQQIHAWYQIREVAGDPTPWSNFWDDGVPALSKLRAAMREHSRFEAFFQMHATRWRMLLEAIRTAEMKYKICLQNWKDKSFFTGADTD